MRSTITTDRDFLFVIDIKDQKCSWDQATLLPILKNMPISVRVFSVIDVGFDAVKIYCVTDNYTDYEMVSDVSGFKTNIVNTRRVLIQ